jgi:predicted glycosyltransferase
MKVLIDIGHPGHVHLFKNFAHVFIGKGHEVYFTIREKEHETDLLLYEKLPFKRIGRHYISGPGKIWGLIYYNLRILFISLKFRPDAYLSHGSVYTLLSSFVLRRPNIALEDSGNREQVRLYLPFTKAVLTSTSFPLRYGSKQVFYNGYHELAYLHPDYFRPDCTVLKELGLGDDDKYSVVRFVAWNASHDRRNMGLSDVQKREIIKYLSSLGRVYISSESSLPPDLEDFGFPLRPERLHHALAFALLSVGEGATMASESAVLGTNAIYISTIRRAYLEEQEREYGLVTCFTGYEGVIDRITQLFNTPDLKFETKKKKERLISDKCDVTGFLIRYMEELNGNLMLQKTIGQRINKPEK